MAQGFVIAAPHSGAGKTLVTLALVRLLQSKGFGVASAKAGPDFIDPVFHSKAGSAACVNLDLWAMGRDAVIARAHETSKNAELLVVEGVMGLFDGADDGSGSTADLANALDLPVILVVNAAGQARSAAALLHGFKTFRSDVRLAGVLFNRVKSDRHAGLLYAAAEEVAVAPVGFMKEDASLAMPSRHLGLVQASEYDDLNAFIDKAADVLGEGLDLDGLLGLTQGLTPNAINISRLPPLGQRIAIAEDRAFAFSYPHILSDWRANGAELCFFSPLNDEAPDPSADAVFLPGGYPELHAGRLSENRLFLDGLRKAAGDALVYGECGGFMVMGRALIDAEGRSHEMAGLLPLVTTFQERKRTLGYRSLTHSSPLPWPGSLSGHEFHYSTLSSGETGDALFGAKTSKGEDLAPMGLKRGRIMGSYAHVIAPSHQGSPA
ncbi:MAG: cobyrinate a,c-diamide synthase [Pseudomonadota bacterium]